MKINEIIGTAKQPMLSAALNIFLNNHARKTVHDRLLGEQKSGDMMPKSPLNDRFFHWFGNSKVVDSHGKPLIVYHGSNAHAYVEGEINVFHTLPASGRGAAFFSSSRELAAQYGEKVYAVYLRIENPLIVFGDGKSWTSLDHTTKIGGRVTDRLRDYHQRQAQEVDDLYRELYGNVAEPTRSQIPDDATDLQHFSLGILPDMQDGWTETDVIVKQARRMGYDGVLFEKINDSPTSDRTIYRHVASNVYAVFRPNQIKSVYNNGEWDHDDPDINS